MSLFISHTHFGIGKIQQIKNGRVEVLFPRSSDTQLRQFTQEAFGSTVKRYVLPPGTPCMIDGQHCRVESLVYKGKGGEPHGYSVIRDDGSLLEVSESRINLYENKNSSEHHGSDRIQPGLLVTTGDYHGFGSVRTVDGDHCDVAFFHHPGTEDIRPYPLNQIERTILSPETRVFVKREEGWAVGRVVDCLDEPKRLYTIRFPNRVELGLYEDELHVRCLSAHHAPVELVAHRGMQTQFFHDPRSAFVRSITEQRNRSQGLSCVLSSSVELVAHQIRAAQQVLTDPVQRYILADEVGLGKTIEAGFVIRQTLLDLPRCRVAVLVPTALVAQWKQELFHKFRAFQFAIPPVVLPYAEADALSELDIELLVVDEAHNIFSSQGQNDVIAELCLNARRLLLLTATPVVGNEQIFLNMLKVLDSDVFNSMSIDTLREKVQLRQRFGALASMLGEDMDGAPPVFMIANIAQRLLASDEEGLALLEALKKADGVNAQAQAKGALYHYIVERHRIFHRLIRNRRKDIPDNVFLPRSDGTSKDHVLTVFDDSPATMELIGLFEEWRQAAYEFLHAVPEDSAKHTAMATDCARLFEAVSAGTFDVELERMVMTGSLGGCVTGADALVAAARQMQSNAPTLASILSRAVSIVQGALGNTRQTGPINIVAFVSDGKRCRELEADFIPPPSVHLEFLNRHGEEGQNLQHAQAIVNLDIPLDPVRMEQRIGRLDRYNRKARFLIHVCRCAGEQDSANPWFSWVQTLIDGFNIFNEPISDVQFLLENERITLAKILLRQGVAGIEEYRDGLAERLAAERSALDDQYAFDQRAPGSDNEIDWLEALEEMDEDEEALSRSLEEFLLKALKLSARKDKGTRRYQWTQGTLVPQNPWKDVFALGLELPSTFSRVKAVRDADVSLLRLGHPLVDTMDRFSRWDIRGLAFATWRACPHIHMEEPWLGFQLNFMVEGDLREWENDLRFTEELAAARRRTDWLLPPWLETLFLDFELEPVTDETLLEQLRYPYRHSAVRDLNLQKRLALLEGVVDSITLERLVRKSFAVGQDLVRNDAKFQTTIEAVRGRAQMELEHRLKRLAMRSLGKKSRSETDDRVTEEMFEKIVARAVLEPAVRLESIGVFVLAPYCPEDVS